LVIAAAIYFHFGRQAMNKYGASNGDNQKLQAKLTGHVAYSSL
jgi:hypothetical protein